MSCCGSVEPRSLPRPPTRDPAQPSPLIAGPDARPASPPSHPTAAVLKSVPAPAMPSKPTSRSMATPFSKLTTQGSVRTCSLAVKNGASCECEAAFCWVGTCRGASGAWRGASLGLGGDPFAPGGTPFRGGAAACRAHAPPSPESGRRVGTCGPPPARRPNACSPAPTDAQTV